MNENAESRDTLERGGWLSGLDRFNRHPVAQVSGYAIGLIGICLAVYFYFAGQAAPRLSYYISPLRTVVVKAGEASDLLIVHKGVALKGSVSAANITIWNAGKSPVRKEDMLAPLEVVFGLRHPVLEVKIRKVSRPIIDASIDQSQLANGIVTLNTRILEHDDGVVLQVIYSGDVDADFGVQGTFIGQDHPIRVKSWRGNEEKAARNAGSTADRKVAMVMVGVGFFILCLAPFSRKLKSRLPVFGPKSIVAVMVLQGVVPIVLGSLMLYMTSDPLPPFASNQ